jgi:hypothetical protein
MPSPAPRVRREAQKPWPGPNSETCTAWVPFGHDVHEDVHRGPRRPTYEGIVTDEIEADGRLDRVVARVRRQQPPTGRHPRCTCGNGHHDVLGRTGEILHHSRTETSRTFGPLSVPSFAASLLSTAASPASGDDGLPPLSPSRFDALQAAMRRVQPSRDLVASRIYSGWQRPSECGTGFGT